MGLGRWGKNLDDQSRIQERVLLVVGENGRATDNRDVRIGERASFRYPNPNVAAGCGALLAPQRIPEFSSEVQYDLPVRIRAAGHRIHSPVVEFALEFRRPFDS